MAELLTKAIDYTHPNPVADREGAYKRGDIVVIKEDGAPWGKLERLAPEDGGKFSIVKVFGTPVASVLHFDKPETFSIFVPVLNQMCDILNTRRAWRLNIDELPPGIIIALNTPGAANLPIATLLAAMERKADGKRGNE